MKYEFIDLKFAKLHLINTKKFRSINIKIILKDKLKKEDITKRNFLIDYLLYSTKKYKTRQKLALKSQELYSLYLDGYNTRLGSFLITNFNLSILNPKYTEENMLEESIEFLREVIFNPNVTNGKFSKKCFEIIKNGILNDIKTIKENSRRYAIIRMLENMGKGYPYSYHGYGYLEDLEQINEVNLYEYYQELIYKNDVDIYVIGDFNNQKMINIIKEKLNFKTLKKKKDNIYIYHDKVNKKPNIVIEQDKFNQSKLSIGCKLINLTDFERKYVINIYNMLLGGSFNSKLMQIIREKHSLAYYIDSNICKADNLLFIQSGISKENFPKVVDNIKKILKSFSKGMITSNELENVKMEYLSLLEESFDDISNIMENYIVSDLLDLDDFETRKKEIKKVTKEDIIKISKKIYVDTIYLLEATGEQNAKN